MAAAAVQDGSPNGKGLVQIHFGNDAAQRPVADDTPVEHLRAEVERGLMYAHSRANANTSKVLEVAAFAYAAIELLIERGVVSVEELDERKRKLGETLLEKFSKKGMGVALLKDEDDKYSYHGEVTVHCASRMPLCRAACCRLRFALSVQDLEEGKVKWDLGQPYMIRRRADGYCHHLDGASGRCCVYQNRPLVCRGYDCRKDKRIWEDFDQRIVSADLKNLFPEEAAAAV